MIPQHPRDVPMENHLMRRLSDKILIAFRSACDQADIEVAWELLNAIEFVMMQQPDLPAGETANGRPDISSPSAGTAR
jgi:hypothetical protein